MGITTYSLIIAIIGGIILFFTGVKSGVKKKYKMVFMALGILLVGIGVYGVIIDLIN